MQGGLTQGGSSMATTDALHHSHNAADIAFSVADAAMRHSALQHGHLSPIEGHIAWQMTPSAAAKAIGAIGGQDRLDADVPGSLIDSQGILKSQLRQGDHECGRVGAHAAPRGEGDACADALRVVGDMHAAGLVVGFKLWQLYRRLLRDSALAAEASKPQHL